jgi:glutamate-1-semialdehyde 2,1-aminomutase
LDAIQSYAYDTVSLRENVNSPQDHNEDKRPTMKDLRRSRELYDDAKRLTPGGVHSSLRFFDPYPVFISAAKGARIFDVDSNEYIDCHLGFGPVVLGHSHPRVAKAVQDQIEKGVIYGLSNELEVEVAKKISTHVPSARMVRFCNSGTEATYHAIRVARAFTRRKKILKFEGAYHGWHDFVSVSSGPSLEEAGPIELPSPVFDTEGISEAAKDTIVVPFNHPEILEKTIRQYKNEIAALITEPILHGSATCILPRDEFLKFVREITETYGILLIFDEVVTGFRHGLGGAQKLFGVTPDLTTFAKAMANGFPVGAVCGRNDIIEKFQPTGKVEYGGTYNGNPVSMAAALATIEELERSSAHQHLFSIGERLRNQLNKCVIDLGFKAQVVGFGSIFQLLFTDKEIRDYRDTLGAKKEEYEKFQRGMMEKGIFIIPKPNKRGHLSVAHTTQDIDYVVESAREILKTLKP